MRHRKRGGVLDSLSEGIPCEQVEVVSSLTGFRLARPLLLCL